MPELPPDALRRQVSLALGKDPDPSWTLLRLPGAASARAYYRIDTGERSLVAMVMPPGQGSEEVSKAEASDELPFLNVHRYLDGLGIRVPRIFRWDEEAQILLLEDLGDRTLELALGAADEGRRERLERYYGAAIDLLATLRAQADAAPTEDCVAFRQAFDVELYRWEIEHYLEWGLGARDGVVLRGAEAERVGALADEISERLDGLQRGFTHRDYQSRNLMVLPGDELVLIDFQDALQGPYVYDLVALLRDSYVVLPMDFIESMLRRYLGRLVEAGGPRLDPETFLEEFHLQTIQRKLKDAGRFVFLDRVKGNPTFLPYVSPSLAYVKEAMERLPAYAEFGAILGKYVPELS